MFRSRLFLNIIACAAGLALYQCGAGGSAPASKPADDFKATMDAYNKATDDETKRLLWSDFLERNPDNRYTVGTIDFMARNYFIKEKQDPDGAIEFARRYMARIKDAKLQKRAEMTLVELYGATGRKEDLKGYAGRIEAKRGLDLGERLTVADAAIEAGEWEFARSQCDTLIEKNTPETVRAEEGDGKLSDERVQSTITRNRGRALISLGRASFHLGDTTAALADFEEAAGLAVYNYAGFPAWPFNDLNQHWATALLEAGRPRDAMDKIAADALILGREDALEVFKKAYNATGDRGSLDDAIAGTRSRIARTMPDFSARDYDGKKVSYRDFKGKATLLAFWFPT